MQLVFNVPDDMSKLSYEELGALGASLHIFEASVAAVRKEIGTRRQALDVIAETQRKVTSMSSDERKALLLLLQPGGIQSTESVGKPGA